MNGFGTWTAIRLSQGGRSISCWRGQGASGNRTLFVAGPCPSSMDLAWELSEKGLFPDGASVLVASQSSGRGQLGRPWHSPAGNLYGTVRLLPLLPEWGGLAPLLLAEAALEVLGGLGLVAEIKWPNDVLVRRKKVGGILLEERSGVVMAGIGLNLTAAPDSGVLRGPQAMPAGFLKEFGVDISPPDMWLRLVDEIGFRMGEVLSSRKPRDVVMNLESHLAYMGEKVVVEASEAAACPATVLGLHVSGGIRVLTAQGERVFCAGSIYPAVGQR
ncbi:MAG TPA: biotin--[acetyl-CoA-carboxylase] ligase [Phycisphaerae bacterium]|nr:biotin--[acetyl-CoA-carboxylase] ligase [Phycisphaerae bacterium]